jgi:hypothetical protein
MHTEYVKRRAPRLVLVLIHHYYATDRGDDQRRSKESEKYVKPEKPLPSSFCRSLDPRDRILQDLKELIVEHHTKGFRPILFMDANKDWTNKHTGTALRSLQETQLQDSLYQQFHKDGLTASTYARGSSRIDYMFFDESLLQSIRCIGTLGLHKAIVSDHVM